jgi:hypothetical protein
MYSGYDFNDNGEKPISWTLVDRARINELRKTEKTETKSGVSRLAQRPNYDGKNIGQHEKVQRKMREGGRRNQGQKRH